MYEVIEHLENAMEPFERDVRRLHEQAEELVVEWQLWKEQEHKNRQGSEYTRMSLVVTWDKRTAGFVAHWVKGTYANVEKGIFRSRYLKRPKGAHRYTKETLQRACEPWAFEKLWEIEQKMAVIRRQYAALASVRKAMRTFVAVHSKDDLEPTL